MDLIDGGMNMVLENQCKAKYKIIRLLRSKVDYGIEHFSAPANPLTGLTWSRLSAYSARAGWLAGAAGCQPSGLTTRRPGQWTTAGAPPREL